MANKTDIGCNSGCLATFAIGAVYAFIGPSFHMADFIADAKSLIDFHSGHLSAVSGLGAEQAGVMAG